MFSRPIERNTAESLWSVSGSGDWDGWLMAIGIGMGFVALELAMLVAPAATRPAVARYAARR